MAQRVSGKAPEVADVTCKESPDEDRTTFTEAEEVQPFAGLVTITLYNPGVLTTLVGVVTPPPQSYVAKGVVEEAVSVTLPPLQGS